MMQTKTWLAILLLGFTSCQFLKKDNEELLVSVYDKELYFSDIAALIPESRADSADFVNSYIDSWVKEQVMLHQADLNLTVEQEAIEQQIENYRNSLLIYAYQQALVSQKMDTTIYEYEIEEYYRKNKSNFELKGHIVRMIYVKVNEEAPNLKKLRQWYRSDKEDDKLLLEEYCYQFAEEFSLDDTTWFYFDDLKKTIPLATNNPSSFLQSNKHIEIQDSTGIYMVRFVKYRVKDGVSPLALEKERIKNSILNKRKLAFLKELENDLFQNELAKGNIKYENN